MKFESAAKALGIPNNTIDSEPQLRIGKNEVELYDLSATQLSGNINGHAFRGKIVTSSLQGIFALLHDRNQTNGEVHLVAL